MNYRNVFLKVMEVGKSKSKALAYLVSCMYLTLYTKINPEQIIDPIVEGKKHKPIKIKYKRKTFNNLE